MDVDASVLATVSHASLHDIRSAGDVDAIITRVRDFKPVELPIITGQLDAPCSHGFARTVEHRLLARIWAHAYGLGSRAAPGERNLRRPVVSAAAHVNEISRVRETRCSAESCKGLTDVGAGVAVAPVRRNIIPRRPIRSRLEKTY